MEQLQSKMGGGHDWLADLPEDVLQRVLFFIPVREVVQNCLLVRRSWCDLWKSMLALRIHVGYDKSELEAHKIKIFVDNVLRLRDNSQGLELCEFIMCLGVLCSRQQISLWIQKAIMCRSQIIRFDCMESLSSEICIMPLISRDLATLELKSIDLRDKLLDFSRCPALKNLLLRFCFIGWTNNISSQSLEHLTIVYCTFLYDTRTRISTPRLISLELSENYGNTPFLESMPLLVNAFVRLHDCEDRCHQEEYGILCSNNGCSKCGANVDDIKDCVLLVGLSKAESLELVAQPEMYLFGRDLMCCLTFSNLKMLLLNEWCMVSDLHPLVCFLQHAPILEKLTLQLGQAPVNWVETEESYNLMEQPFPSKKFRVAEVFYEEFDKRVEAVSRILKAYGRYLQHIQLMKSPSEYIQVVKCVQTHSGSVAEQNELVAPCYCSKCIVKGSPTTLLHHFAEKSGPHSWPVQKISYDTSYPFVGPVGKVHRRLLVAEEDGAVFLLSMDNGSSVHGSSNWYPVGLVCITGDSIPAYEFFLSVLGPHPASEGQSRMGSLLRMDMFSCSAPDEVDLVNMHCATLVNKRKLHRGFKEVHLNFIHQKYAHPSANIVGVAIIP